ncbi:OmpP1/FadL family transporter [Zhouia sp. PK063]|uniref:OmpP1/FadL family transporter n=1 Tax=Zhouia sp. PK063 TaxID=3373602 RepID=UPI00379FEF18
MMKIRINSTYILSLVLVITCGSLWAQSESLTSSPYSVYGLGVSNQSNIGRTNGMGRAGIALTSERDLNNLNPASYATIGTNSFFYDVGLKADYNNFSNSWSKEHKTNFNFSNLAFGFSIKDKFGIGVALIPFTDVGYQIKGNVKNVEGSTESFTSTISGVGGLNELKINSGLGIGDKLRLGLSASALFGSINENETVVLTTSVLEVDKTSNYKGLRLGGGLQFDVTKGFSLGATVQLPTTLYGNATRDVIRTTSSSSTAIETDNKLDIDNFKLPLELGAGISAKLFDGFTLAADYKKNYWNKLDQKDEVASYKDQDIYNIGFEFLKDPMSYHYINRVRFRGGFTYDNGYLSLDNTSISNYEITAGLGIPINPRTSSVINISYSYGQRGEISTTLVKENYHLITLNLSLEDIWFLKPKIN